MVNLQAGEVDLKLKNKLAQGFSLLRQGRTGPAAELSEGLRATHPDNAEVLYLASEVFAANDELEQALATLLEAIAIAPGQIALLLKHARILIALNRPVDARAVAASAVEPAAKNPHALGAIARILGITSDPKGALELIERACAMLPNDNDLLYESAALEFYLGDFDSAETKLDRLLSRSPHTGHALSLRSSLRRQTAERNHVAELEAIAQSLPADDRAQVGCHFALAKELEDLGESDRAFAALTTATAQKRKLVKYDGSENAATLKSIRDFYNAEAMLAETPGHDEAGAIFIVGMPRTGTTLVERMLGRHEEVRSAGELLTFGQVLASAARRAGSGQSLVEATLATDYSAVGRDYMRAPRQLTAGSPYFIDKMPINYMYCGMIRKALPQARIIHLVRDPMDCCYAVYKTLFNEAYHFSYDLNELADYYIAYREMMQHWHQVMPGQILDVRYEDLVTDTEAQAKRIVEHCGLDWQPAVLDHADNDEPATTASAAQVREPVYTSSVQKWRKYEQGLEPLRARLEAAGVLD